MLSGGQDRLRQQRGLRHAWCNVDLEEPDDTLGVNDEVGSGDVAKAECLVRRDRGVLYSGSAGLVESRGREVLDASWVVASVVVVRALRNDFYGRERLDARGGLHNGHGDLSTHNGLLNEGQIGVRKAVHKRLGEAAGILNVCDAEGGATAGGLHHEGKTDLLHYGFHDGLGAELAEQRLGQRHVGRGGNTRGRQNGLGYGLVPRHAALAWARTQVRNVEQFEDVAQRPVLAGSAVQQRPHEVRLLALQTGDEVRVNVEDVHGNARGAQRLSNAAPGTKGNVAFVGKPTGENDNVWSGAHAISGPGMSVSVTSSSCGVVPKISTDSRSAETTAERRRMPSRIVTSSG